MRYSSAVGSGCGVSTAAEAILAKAKALPADEQRMVCEEIAQFAGRRQAWKEQRVKLCEMQTRHAGRGLLKRLRDERATERACG